jgi:hypothetical protein
VGRHPQAVPRAEGDGRPRRDRMAGLEADRKPDGSLRQDNVFRYVLATK